jgi:septum formation protein
MGLRFECTAAAVTEHEDSHQDPIEQCLQNASLKAQWVLQHCPQADLVLGADTVVALGQEVLNKPRDLPHAYAMLRKLSGQTHQVYTGVYLGRRSDGLRHTEAVCTAVTFYPLSEATLAEYCARVHVLDKSGAYAIQQGLGWIIQGYEGSLHNVMGLPTERLAAILASYGLQDQLSVSPQPA